MISQKENLSATLKTLPKLPGVYRFFDKSHTLIYVGKAKSLFKRVNSYFQKKAHDAKTMRMVSKVEFVEFTVTSSDYDAFILESNLIKKHKPYYNIFFKDDKSYPYVVVSHHEFPRLYGFRGKTDKKSSFFGPYPSLSSVKDTLSLLQKLFPIRQCQQSYYKARTRPCLQYQIKRCLAPCVGLTTNEEYSGQVELLKEFLEGKLTKVLARVSEKMQQASEKEAYELAAKLRDQLMLLRRLQEKQNIQLIEGEHIDILGLYILDNQASLSLLSVRYGNLIGDKNWLIKLQSDESQTSILTAFLSQYYLNEISGVFYPNEIILPLEFNANCLENDLLEVIAQKANHKISWLFKPRGIKNKWQNLAKTNAEQKLMIQKNDKNQLKERFETLQTWLKLDEIPKRIECIDISHFQGEATIASCVAFNINGSDKENYRKFNIEGVRAGDDYQAIRQTVERRVLSGIEKENLPDILIIDGGKGQLKEAEEILKEYKIKNVKLLSLAKGKERISGKEDIFIYSNQAAKHLPEYDPGFLLLRQIRDEAHRFAITGQRKKISKQKRHSVVEEIEGIGPKRKKALLHHFGGWQELSKASVDELTKVQGISKRLAEELLKHLKK